VEELNETLIICAVTNRIKKHPQRRQNT